MERKKRKKASTSDNCKRFLVTCIRMINDKERHFFAKFIEEFSRLNHKHQSNLLRYFSDKCDQKKWKDCLEDTTMYNDVIRSILFYYSGREELGQPSKKEMAHALREYIESSHYKEAEEEESEVFMESLETA
jgi:hypothetical protein